MPTTRRKTTTRAKTPARKAAPRYPAGRYHLLHLAAPNTPSGNPRRAFLATHMKTGTVFVFDEGYLGYNAVPKAITRNIIGPYRINVTASELKRQMALYAA